MAEDTAVLEAIKEGTKRQEASGKELLRAMGQVSNDVRDLATAIAKGFAQRPQSSSNNNWTLLFGVGALMFGLLTPTYVLLGGLSDSLAKHTSTEAHGGAIRAIAAITENLKEVETQFDGVRERIEITHGFQDSLIQEGRKWRAAHDLRVVGLNAAQWERIRFLERTVFGEGLPITQGRGAGSEE